MRIEPRTDAYTHQLLDVTFIPQTKSDSYMQVQIRERTAYYHITNNRSFDNICISRTKSLRSSFQWRRSLIRRRIADSLASELRTPPTAASPRTVSSPLARLVSIQSFSEALQRKDGFQDRDQHPSPCSTNTILKFSERTSGAREWASALLRP